MVERVSLDQRESGTHVSPARTADPVGLFCYMVMDLTPIHGSGKSYARKAKRAVEKSAEMILMSAFDQKFGKLKKEATSKEKREWAAKRRAFVQAGLIAKSESESKATALVREKLNERLRESSERGRSK